MRVRIAFTHAFCWPEVRRGGERFIQELGAALVRRGHQVTILSAGWDTSITTLAGVRTERLRRTRTSDIAHEADFGRRVAIPLATNNFDVVHSMGRRDAQTSIRVAKVRPGRTTVITDLGMPIRSYWETVGAREARVVQRVTEGIDIYSCMSRYALSFLAKDYGRTDGVVIPGGVDMNKMRPAEHRAERPTILMSGAFTEPRKGLGTLLAALPLVAEQFPEVKVQLSGPGDPTPFLAGHPVETVNRVEILGVGESDRQHERYGAAWVTALPSVDDSFGMALIESLSCGTPIVVTTNGAPQELVEVGFNGYLSEPHDPRSLATALIEGLRLSGQASTVDNCRASVTQFDWDAGLAPLCESLYMQAGAK